MAFKATALPAGANTHGKQHWQPVARIGGPLRDARPRSAVARLVAILHDSRLVDESCDRGRRAARSVESLHAAGVAQPPARQVSRPVMRSRATTTARHRLDPTVGTCWDADRLCPPRVGVARRDGLQTTPGGGVARPRPLTVIYEPLKTGSVLAFAEAAIRT